MPSQIQGHKLELDLDDLFLFFFFKGPKIGAQKILQHNENFCDIINKPASCYNSHEIRKAYVPLWSPD